MKLEINKRLDTINGDILDPESLGMIYNILLVHGEKYDITQDRESEVDFMQGNRHDWCNDVGIPNYLYYPAKAEFTYQEGNELIKQIDDCILQNPSRLEYDLEKLRDIYIYNYTAIDVVHHRITKAKIKLNNYLNPNDKCSKELLDPKKADPTTLVLVNEIEGLTKLYNALAYLQE